MTNAALASWVDGAAKRAITEFVERVTTPGDASFVPQAERIAVFDNDGVLWCEKPMPIELGFILQRLEVMAQQDVSLRNRHPWQAAYDHDYTWVGQAITKHYQGDDSDVKLLIAGVIQAFAGRTVDDYEAAADIFLHQGKHPTLGRPFTDCGYLPMIELLRYLEGHGFTNFIASAGDRDFMRTVTQEVYGVPVDRVMGSSNALRYRDTESGGTVVYVAEPDVFDDGPAKPVRIWSRIGRRPIIAAGNSNGDIPMLRFAGGGSIPALRIVILHDDPAREFDYVTGAERALQLARTQRWTVVSMKNDWSLVFASSKIKKERRAPTSAA